MDIKERSNYGIIIAILVILVLVAVSYNNTANMVWDEGAEGVGGEDTMLVIEAEECTLYDWYIIQQGVAPTKCKVDLIPPYYPMVTLQK